MVVSCFVWFYQSHNCLCLTTKLDRKKKFIGENNISINQKSTSVQLCYVAQFFGSWRSGKIYEHNGLFNDYDDIFQYVYGIW